VASLGRAESVLAKPYPYHGQPLPSVIVLGQYAGCRALASSARAQRSIVSPLEPLPARAAFSFTPATPPGVAQVCVDVREEDAVRDLRVTGDASVTICRLIDRVSGRGLLHAESS
jgi:hypothetical protein